MKIELIGWCLIFLALGSYHCSVNPGRQVSSYIEAHNAHEIDKLLAFLHDSIAFQRKGAWTKTGKATVRQLEAWDSTLSSHLKIKAMATHGDSVYCTLEEQNDWFRAIGVKTLVHDPTIFVLKNHKPSEIIAFPDPRAGRKVSAAIGSIYEWSHEQGDTTVNALIVNGEFIYSAKAAAQWQQLLRRWNASQTE